MNNKQKFRKVYESLIQYLILIQLTYLNLNEIRLLLIIDQIRSFSYIIQPTLSHPINNPYLIFKIISYIPRPYLIFKVNYKSFITLVIIFLIFICIIMFKVSIYVLVKQNQKYILLNRETTLKHFLDSQISFFKMIDRMISIFIYFLEKNILQCSVEQFLSVFLAGSVISKIVAILFITFFFLVLYFKIVNLGQTFLFQSEMAQLRKLLIIFQIIQSILFILALEFQLVQYIMCIFITLILLSNIFYSAPYLSKKQYLIAVFIQSFTFIFAITEIIVLYKYIDHQQSLLFILIVFPFCLYILSKQQYNNSLKLLFYKLKQNTKFKKLQFRNLYILINDKNSKQVVIKAIINQIHFNYCQQCQCSQQQIGNQIIIQFSKELFQEQQSDYIENNFIYIFSLFQGQQYIQSYIESEELLNKRNNQLNMNQLIRCKLMIEISKNTLKLKLYKFEERYFQYLNDFYEGQVLIIIINNCVIKSIQLKEKFIQKFQKYTIIEDKLFNLCLKYAKKIFELYQILLDLKEKQQNRLLNNTIIFYQAEILNDYIGAYKLHLQSIDQKSKINEQSIEFSSKSSNVSYIITVLKDQSYNMIITSTSNNASNFFEVTIPQSINNLIPLGIREHHSQYIEQLLVYGKSGRYRTLSNVFAQQKQYINLVDSYLDTYFNMNQLTFVNIFIEKDDVHSYIIINKRFQITGINRILLLMMNYKQSTIKRFEPQSLLYGLHINYIIPHFDHQIRQFVNNNQTVSLTDLNNQFNTEFKFFKQKIISKLNQKNYEERLQDNNYIQIYDSIVEIEIKYLKEEIAYYVLKIISLRKKTLTLSTSFQSNFQTMQDDFIENDFLEDVDVNSPLIFQDIVPENTISSENSSNKINTNHHFEGRLQRKLKTMKVADDHCYGRNQQRFFTRRLGIANSDLSIQIQESFRQRTQKKKITYNESSEFTLSYKIKNSIYFDKYQMIQNFSNQHISSKYSKLSSIFFIVSCILGIISLLIQSSIIKTDFNNYNKDIRYLKVKQDMLQPIMNQVILRVILLNINQNTTDNFNQSEIVNLLNNEFNIFHQSVDSILQDNEISGFFDNIIIPIKLDDKSNEYQTFREVISSFQQYLFHLMMIYKFNQFPLVDDPAIQYTYRNYQSLSKEFSKISQLILDRTIQRNSSQIDSQTIIIVCFLCFNSIFLLLSYRYNKFNYQMRSLFSNLFMNFEKGLYQIELEQIQYMQKTISIEDIQFYSFNIQYKEKLLNKLQKQVGDKIEKTQFFKLPANNKVLMYSIVLGIMCILFLSVNLLDLLILSNFTTVYQPTALLYQETSILGISIAQIFAQRQILYDYDIFKFLDETDRQILLNQVQDSLTQIDQSRKIFINEENTKYLYTNQYQMEFQKDQHNNLCVLLNQIDMLKYTISSCEYFLQGSLKLGLQNVLSYLANTINSEISLSQDFKDKSYQGNKDEYIGGFLLSKIIQIIVSQGQADLLGQIQSYNQILQIILITSISFIIMIILIIIIFQITIYNRELEIAKRFIHILPKSIIFLDNSFERRVTNTIINNQNI